MNWFNYFLKPIPPGVCSMITLAAILWLTLAPQPVGDVEVPLFPGADKVAHAIMFGCLAWMFSIDYTKLRSKKPSIYILCVCALMSFLIGALIEWLQLIMDLGRSFEYADLFADAVGCLFATLILRFF